MTEKSSDTKKKPELHPLHSFRWIDVHTHLDMLKGNPQSFVKRAMEQGVHSMITISTEPAAQNNILKLAKDFSPNVFCTLGAHPQQSDHYTEETESLLCELGQQKEVLALGEMGLDYHYKEPPPSLQKKVLFKANEPGRKTAPSRGNSHTRRRRGHFRHFK